MDATDMTGARSSGQAAIVAIADSEAGGARCRRAADAIGARLIDSSGTEDALALLSRPVRFDAALVDLEHDAGAALDSLTAALDAAAADGRYRSVVSVPLGLVDAVEARLAHPGIELLCAASDVERAAALAMATSARRVFLHDSSRNDEDARLLRLSEEVGRIARALAELSQADPGAATGGGRLGEAPFAYRAEASPPPPALTPARIRAILRTRRLRGRFFDETLFADPAWDMLLDLMAARLEAREVAVSSLCIAAAVPPTTALRWIKTLTDRGLFVRRSDPRDGRRVFIELADEAAAAMTAWFAAAAQGDVTAS